MGELRPDPEAEEGVRCFGLDGLAEGALAWMHHRHPDGRHVVLRVPPVPEWVGVWDVETGRLVRRLDGDNAAMAWLPPGDHLLMIRVEMDLEPDPTPYARRWRRYWERRRWPDGKLVTRWELPLPGSWLDRIVPSPRGDLAAVHWIEQHEAGIVLIQIDGDTDRLLDAGYRVEPNFANGPVFSPDGRYLALSCSRSGWWNPGDADQPSKGGRFTTGHIAVLDLLDPAAPIISEHEITEAIPPGWFTDGTHLERDELMGWPRFVGALEVAVRIQTGREVRVSFG